MTEPKPRRAKPARAEEFDALDFAQFEYDVEDDRYIIDDILQEAGGLSFLKDNG